MRWIRSLLSRWFGRSLFASRTRQAPQGAYCNAIELDELGDADGWLRVVPIGENPTHPDGPHEVTSEHIEQMAANFERTATDLLVDVDHDSLFGGSTRAVGWGAEVEAREDGLYMRHPEWTPRGEEIVSSRDYRYLSPVYFLNYQNRSGEEIGAYFDSVAITNRPYFKWGEVDPIGNSDTPSDSTTKASNTMDREQLIEELGLEEHATDEEILQAVREAKAASTDDDPGESDDPASDDEPADEPDDVDDPEDLEAKVNSIINRLDAKDKADEDERAEELIDAAISEGKILPAQRKVYLNSARSDYDGTKELLEGMKSNSRLPSTIKTPKIGSERRTSSPLRASTEKYLDDCLG